ncbi:ankyrin repeat domain-containing protein 50 [Platysternon megacephalum]|uniref:Ankyrin repeat domain-containing protein 50 n=1 Tax=Platysternon megacephalum TaxID=55544 RepID=A0A4D9FA08_9SAUR|nr:ankyrin repeat domain-containing protein 50 [Platysternon megacephalum]
MKLYESYANKGLNCCNKHYFYILFNLENHPQLLFLNYQFVSPNIFKNHTILCSETELGTIVFGSLKNVVFLGKAEALHAKFLIGTNIYRFKDPQKTCWHSFKYINIHIATSMLKKPFLLKYFL